MQKTLHMASAPLVCQCKGPPWYQVVAKHVHKTGGTLGLLHCICKQLSFSQYMVLKSYSCDCLLRRNSVRSRKGSPSASSRSSPSNPAASPDKVRQSQGARASPPGENERQDRARYSRSPVRSPARKAPAPASDQARNLSRSPSPSGNPKRIRKGRGFSERYAFARRYRTPSPDRSPVRSQYYRGRNERGRDYDR